VQSILNLATKDALEPPLITFHHLNIINLEVYDSVLLDKKFKPKIEELELTPELEP
jgi:hypothetical protein